MNETNCTITKDNPHSVKFAITSKGLWSCEVKVYSSDPQDAITEAASIANEAERICKDKNKIEVEKNGNDN